MRAIAIGSLLFLYWVTLPVVLGALAETRGYSEDTLGMLASFYSAGIFFATVCSFFWIHRLRWTSLVRVGSLLSCLGFFLVMSDNSFLGLASGYLIASIGLGMAYAVIMACLGERAHPARDFALVFFFQVVLGVTGSLLLSNVVAVQLVVQISAAAMIAVGAICAILGGGLPERSHKRQAQSSADPASRIPPTPILFGLLAILLVFTGDAGIWIFLERIGNAVRDTEFGGLLVSVNLASGAFGSLSAAWLSERLGYLRPMVLAIALSILSVALLGGTEVLALLIVASFINGWAWNFGAAYRMGLVSKLDVSGRYAVLIPAMQTLGNSMGPLFTGMIIVRGGYDMAFLAVSILWLAALAAYYPAWLSYRDHEPVTA